MRHPSAESALYCRVITEGLLGLVPTGFDTLQIRPRLPERWREQGYALEHLALLGRALDVVVQNGAAPRTLRLTVKDAGRVWFDRDMRDGEAVDLTLRD